MLTHKHTHEMMQGRSGNIQEFQIVCAKSEASCEINVSAVRDWWRFGGHEEIYSSF